MRQGWVMAMMVPYVLAGCVSSPPATRGLEPATPLPEVIVDPVGDSPIFLDVAGGSLWETPSALVVTVKLARLEINEVPAAFGASDFLVAAAEVCWNAASDCAGIMFTPGDDPAPVGYYASTSDGTDRHCNNNWWYWCDWQLPATIEQGAPATLTISVPRELLADSHPGAVLEKPFVRAWALHPDPLLPDGSGPKDRGSLTVVAFGCAAGQCFNQGLEPDGRADEDRSGEGPDLTLRQSTMGTLGRPSPQTVLFDKAHDVLNSPQGYRPDLDILSIDIDETSNGIALLVRVANLPTDFRHSFEMELGINGTMYQGAYDAVVGRVVRSEAGYCTDGSCTGWKVIDLQVEVTPGTPGTIRAALPWAQMAHPRAGDLVELMDVALNEGVTAIQRPGTLPGTYAYVYSNAALDAVLHPKVYFLQTGSGD